MNKYSKLAKNTGIFFIANFGSKILTFLLVRFYTELLSQAEYGVIDLVSTTASLAFPILTLCITEAVLRFSIDDGENLGKTLTNGLFVAALGNLVFIFLMPALMQIDLFADNVAWLYLLTLSNSFHAIVTHFSRGIGKTKLFAAAGLMHTILQIGLNIIFLITFSWGMRGYFISAVLANVVTTAIVFVWGGLHKYIIKEIDKKYLRVMLVYAIPLIPNSVFWWIMQSSNRYFITFMLSEEANGLYAVANKIPTLITTISGIFFQAWQLSAVEEVTSKDKSVFYTKVFSALSTLLIIASSFIMVVLQPVYRVLTEESFYVGWTSTPFLLCAMVYSCYSSFLGTNYVAMKKTNGVFLTTVIGAVANIVFNIVFIPVMGLEGSALATLFAFIITWASRIIGTRHFVKIQYPMVSFWLPSLVILLQAMLLTFITDSILVQLGLFLLVLLLLNKEIIYYVTKGVSFVSSKSRKGTCKK